MYNFIKKKLTSLSIIRKFLYMASVSSYIYSSALRTVSFVIILYLTRICIIFLFFSSSTFFVHWFPPRPFSLGSRRLNNFPLTYFKNQHSSARRAYEMRIFYLTDSSFTFLSASAESSAFLKYIFRSQRPPSSFIFRASFKKLDCKTIIRTLFILFYSFPQQSYL